ncbi:SDR family oxidoreductase [Methylobacterium sp. 10]|uniref:SDR family oxidoreductase n=1 Tax=Methylobacterium sp. 10 TaxID=1101191 RepID=UPI0004B17556|nr:SDR family oxidoreductase [Methylobacterium sp. 10]
MTGGSRGIGAATVRRLARDGADVALSYAASRESAEDIVREVESLVREAHVALRRLFILVNSAGVFVTGMVDDAKSDRAAFDRQLDVNVKGVAAAVRATVPLMTDGGRIVSIGTVHFPFAGAADYVATMAAVAAYIRGWARDFGPRNITVNVVQPDAINTDMNPQDGPFAETLRGLAALGRYGQPEDIAAAVSFLAGPDAGYVTGATLNVDGGQSA